MKTPRIMPVLFKAALTTQAYAGPTATSNTLTAIGLGVDFGSDSMTLKNTS